MQLELVDLSVCYGAVRALDRLSLKVESGTVAAIIGANGAGKSTILRSIAGLVKPESGAILIDGRPIDSIPAEKRTRLGIALSPEGRQLFPEMTVHDNLLTGAFTRRDRKGVAEDLSRVYRLFPQLVNRRRNAGRNLSGGEQQMVAIGRALMASPRLLLLDEPSLGLAPAVIREMADAIRLIARTGVTVILVARQYRPRTRKRAPGPLRPGRRADRRP
jgi:branched-chain amino acid transport system ATP-binding protein